MTKSKQDYERKQQKEQEKKGRSNRRQVFNQKRQG